MVPKKFKQRYKNTIPDFERFLAYYKKTPQVSIRINTIKISREKFLKTTTLKLKQVPWYKDGFFVGEQASYLANTLEHFLGYFYLQDAASMLPPLVLKPKENESILDLTAAPGSKTTQISQMLNNKGCIIANDNAYERIRALRGNINRLGCMNIAITRFDTRHFPNSQFDKILLDAPCSLEGSMRKYFIKWNEKTIRNFAVLQKKMITRAWQLLKPNGTLVYSTCTYAPEENEGVIQYLLNQNKDAEIEPVKVRGIKMHPGITSFRDTSYSPELKKTARVYIHDYNTSGFYIAKLRKK
ncbi:tRNA methyltransferase [Candidatus Pacearchaeota archaeon ex4484_26]|nr:MAG: tRNA methyltransferase [Candidatus Pacearchaeota archaeon ex4484_26]